MSELSRIKALAGINTSKDNLAIELKKHQKVINESFELASKQVERGQRLDEGLFTSLLASLSAIGQGSVIGTKALIDKAKKISEPVKELYRDAKAKLELKGMIDGTEEVAEKFEKMERDSRTLLQRDADIKLSFDAFKTTLADFANKLAARGAVTQANESLVQLTELNSIQLFEQFAAPWNKLKAIKECIPNKTSLTEEQFEIIIHALASALSSSEIRKLDLELNPRSEDKTKQSE